MADLCVCGHEREKHWLYLKRCLAIADTQGDSNIQCSCSKYTPQETSASYTIQLDAAGNARIRLQLGEVELVMTSNSLVELSLEGLRTANIARIQEALAKYAYTHNIPLEDLVQP